MMLESAAHRVSRDGIASVRLDVLPVASRDVSGRCALSFAMLMGQFVVAIEAPKRCRRRRSTDIRPSQQRCAIASDPLSHRFEHLHAPVEGGRGTIKEAINELRKIEVRLRREREMMRESTADRVSRDGIASVRLDVLPAAPRDVSGRCALSFARLMGQSVVAIEAPKRCRRRRSTNIRPSIIR